MPVSIEKTEDGLAAPAPRGQKSLQQSNSRNRIRGSLRAKGYEQGARALSPREAEGRPATEKTENDEGLKTYQSVLGDLFGGKLYEIVAKHTTPEALNKHAMQVVDGLIKAAASQVKRLEGLDAEGKEAATAVVAVLGQLLREQAEAFMASEPGQALVKQISTYIATHPAEVLAAVILAAVAAYFANADIPEIAAKASFGSNTEAELKAKLGKVRDIALESISAKINHEAGRFKAGAELEYKQGGSPTGKASLSYGSQAEGPIASATATIDKEGLVSAQLGAAFRKGTTSGSAAYTWSREGSTATAEMVTGDRGEKYSGSATYDFEKRLLTARFAREVTDGIATQINAVKLEGDKVSSEQINRYQKAGQSIEISRSIGPAGDVNTGLKAKYSSRDLTVALDAVFAADGGGTATASAEKHSKEGMVYKAEASYSLNDSRFLSYGVHFGFRDPEQFRGFLLEYKRNNVPEIPEDEFKATVEFTIQQMMIRVRDETTLKGGKLASGTVSGHAAYPISKDFMLIGGVTQGYGPERTTGTRPEIGVQIRNVPVLVGYDMNSKTWTLRLTIPFGR